MDQLLFFFTHHPLLFAALGVVIALIVANELHGGLTGGKRLSVVDAVRLINDRDPIILDVRPHADFKRGHLLNAVNVPVTKIDDAAARIGRERDKPVLVYCALGGASAGAAEKLRQSGFAEVYPLRGGINAWLTSNLPVTTK